MSAYDPPIQTNLLNGLLSNCAAFDKWLQAWFSTHKIEEEDQWWQRDMLASAWDAGVRSALGLTPTPEEMRAHADAADRCNLPDDLDFCEERQDAEIARLKELCLRAAGYIGVRQGPEVDAEADELLRCLRGET